MQSVVTGQATITLERKNYLRRKNKQKQKIIHTITETNRIPQTKKKGEISVHIYQDTYEVLRVSYAKRVAAEAETEEAA